MIAFSIGSLHIYRYGIFYAISFAGGYFFLYWFAYTRFFTQYDDIKNILKKHIDELFTALILGVLIGGRLGHCFIYYPTYYISHPLDIFKIREGGMSFIGGFIGVTLGVLWFKKKHKLTTLQMLKISDILLVFLPLAIALGRIGNYLNQELYGIIVPQDFWGMSKERSETLTNRKIFTVYTAHGAGNNLRINTNFLAAFGEGLLLFIIQIFSFISKVYRKFPGMLTGQFITGYSFVRFFLEYLRADSNQEFIGSFTISQYYFMAGISAGIAIVYYSLIRNSKKNA